MPEPPEMTLGDADIAEGTQLEYGAATAFNEAVAGTPQAQPVEVGARVPALPPQEEVVSIPDYRPQGDEEEILFLDPEAPVQAAPPVGVGRLPSSVIRYLPLMREAASHPEAPQSLRMIYAALVNSLEDSLR